MGSFAEGSKNPMTDKYTKVYRKSSYRSNASKQRNLIISNHGNPKFEYGEFEFGSEWFEEQIGYRGEREDITTSGIG
jgi:hypothetical protein